MSDDTFDSVDIPPYQGSHRGPVPLLRPPPRKCPVTKEPYHDVYMVTGYDEAIAVYHDQATFSNCISAIRRSRSSPFPSTAMMSPRSSRPTATNFRSAIKLPTFDPPKHTAHRGLLMRLITPKRLKENEASLRRLADRQIDRFHARGECEFVSEYAGPYTLLVIADLLGVPEKIMRNFLEKLMHHDSLEMTHKPLEYLYAQFTTYIEDRRPRTSR